MEEEKDISQYYTRGSILAPSEMMVQYYPKIQKERGRWSFEEHQTFVNCLKKYGKNWNILEEMIPTRTGIQIRSHLQKYFDKIKKDYNTDNPMEYVLQNMCDATPLYQFESSESFHVQEKSSETLDGKASERRPGLGSEVISSNSCGDENQYNCANFKKRDLKAMAKSMQDSFSSTMSKEKKLQSNSSCGSSIKLFKIERVSKSRTDSFSNSNSDSKVNVLKEFIKPKQKSKPKGANKEAMTKIKKGCSIVALNRGRVIIQAERIESLIPSQYKQLDKETNMILPKYPCTIQIMPLSQMNASIGSKLDDNQASMNNYQSKIEGDKIEFFSGSASLINNFAGIEVVHPKRTAKQNDLLEGMDILSNIFCFAPSQN